MYVGDTNYAYIHVANFSLLVFPYAACFTAGKASGEGGNDELCSDRDPISQLLSEKPL